MSVLDDTDDPKRASRRPLYVFLVITLVVGAIGSLLVQPSIPTWYARLDHPAITPPNWVFAPVWTALYIVMAFAAWRTWRVTGTRSIEMLAFAVQLAFNLGWSAVFFFLHQIAAALVEVLLLDLAVLTTLLLFWRRDRVAGLLLLPYLAWSCFATLLTYEFWRLNH